MHFASHLAKKIPGTPGKLKQLNQKSMHRKRMHIAAHVVAANEREATKRKDFREMFFNLQRAGALRNILSIDSLPPTTMPATNEK